MLSNRARWGLGLGGAAILAAAGMAALVPRWMGKQPDGSFVVSTGQRVEAGSLAFEGRPIDLALHPTGEFFAVLNKRNVFLANGSRIFGRTRSVLGNGTNAGYHGLAWSPDGKTLHATTDKGHIQTFAYEGLNEPLRAKGTIDLRPKDDPQNPVPGGIAITRDGKSLFVVSANRGEVIEVDTSTNKRVRRWPVQNIPYEPKLTDDESTIIVSNWGGRPPKPGEPKAKSEDIDILTDAKGANASGTISIIDRATGKTTHVEVGIHPSSLLVRGDRVFVSNAMSDSISEVDWKAGKVARTIPILWSKLRVLGCMPNALAIQGDTLYAADGGDNALAEIDLKTGEVLGFRPAGYFPVAVSLAPDGKTAFVLNSKGNGSVTKTSIGLPGNAHDFQGTVTAVDLTKPIAPETAKVAANNRWNASTAPPPLKVYNGAIKHVLYIIKENRTYDEVFGDIGKGNGEPKLCSLGEKVMPNHRKLAREFTLFDNGYVSGTNSADGHQWSTQAIANDYLEHFYVGYSRTYPCEGEDPMALSNAGAIWDAALAKKKTLRVWGEFCDETQAGFYPMPKDWFELWEDRLKGTKKFKFNAETTVASIKPYINKEVHYWPLLQSDQFRADVFIREYEEFSKQDRVPNLMVMSLPCDHGEGTNPKYPTPRAMMADNDLALGRVVEAVSKSPQWKDTCIFVIEDDAQAGPDHVDGHRTVFMAISPYTKRGYLDSSFYTTTSMIRSMGLMLGLDPLNKFDALADPMIACFSDTPDLAPYKAVPNNVPLDERNPSGRAMTEQDEYWLEKTMELDWTHLDGPDPYWLNRINWWSIYKGSRPYPAREGEQPGQHDPDDDDD